MNGHLFRADVKRQRPHWSAVVASGLMTASLLCVASAAQAQVPIETAPTATPAPSMAPDDYVLTPSSPQEGAVVVVNDEVISTVDLRNRLALILVTTGLRPQDQETLQQIQGEALENLVNERVKMQETKRLGIEISDEQVDEALRALARDNDTSVQGLQAELQALGGDIRSLRDQIRTDIAWQRLLTARYGTRLRISNDQIDNTLERIAANADKPQYLISEIVIDIIPGREAEAESLAVKLIDEMRRGAPFPALARQFSSSSSAANGGDIGWVAAGELGGQTEQVLRSIDPGQVSRPFLTQDGIKILALRDRRSGTANRVSYSLKQAVIPIRSQPGTPEARTQEERAWGTMSQLRQRITGCDDFEQIAQSATGVQAGGIDDIARENLAPSFQAAIDGLDEGQVSEPIRTQIGVHILGLCRRTVDMKGALPSRDQVEIRLQNQQLSMISKRYLRDLKRAATIEGR